MVKVALFLLIPLMLMGIAKQIVNNNPELYRYIPVWPVEHEGNDQIKAGIGLQVLDVFTLPKTASRASKINYVIPYPGYPQRLLYNDMNGSIGIIEGESVRPLPFMEVEKHFGDRFIAGKKELGLLSFAFHPDFLNRGSPGEGKIYTVHSEKPSSVYRKPTNPYFGLVDKNAHHLSVISEWQIAPVDNVQVDSTSQRLVLVLEQPHYNHNIYHIAFNPTSQRGTDDYGMIYIGVGDGGQASRLDRDEKALFGKILRINPLGDGGPGYTIPPSNPFVSSDVMRPEVWAYGFRNPQQFSWDQQTGQMYASDIGEDNAEEVNIVVPGKNYGWSYFEGMNLVSGSRLQTVEKPILPPEFFPVNFPVVDYDHHIGSAVSGGFVYRGTDIPELQGQYVFGDISKGRLFYFDTDGVGPGDRPELFEISLFSDEQRITMTELVNRWRVDLRFAQDARGELLLLNKRDNIIRTLAVLK